MKNNFLKIIVLVVLIITTFWFRNQIINAQGPGRTSITLEVNDSAGGSISSGGVSSSVWPGTSLSVVYGKQIVDIKPNPGYYAYSVTGCDGYFSRGDTTYTTGFIASSTGCTVYAVFFSSAIGPSTITTFVDGGHGTISPSQQVDFGSSATFYLNPESSYSVDSVTGCNGALDNNTNTYTTGQVFGSCAITASFMSTTDLKQYTVYPPSLGSGSGGSIFPNTPQKVYEGATTSFYLTPDGDYYLQSASGCANGKLIGNTYTTGKISSDCHVFASFAKFGGGAGLCFMPITTSVIGGVIGGHGSIDPSGSQEYNCGVSRFFSVTAEPGYHISDTSGSCVYWFGTSTGGGAYSPNPIGSASGEISMFIYPRSNPYPGCDINVSFAKNKYKVTATAGPGGSIAVTPQTIDHGQKATFTVTPDSTHDIASVGAGDTPVNGFPPCPIGPPLVGNTYTTGPIVGDCNVDSTFQAKITTPGPDLTAELDNPPATATINTSVNFYAIISNIGDAPTPAGVNFTNSFQISPIPDPTDASVVTNYPVPGMSDLGAQKTAPVSESLTFQNTGPMYVRVCADKSSTSDVNGKIVESNSFGTGEKNNCGSWTQVTVSGATNLPDLAVGAVSPTSVPIGPDVTFSATITNKKNVATGTDFPYFFQFAPVPGGFGPTYYNKAPSTMPALSANGGAHDHGFASYSTTTVGLPAGATWSARVCADKTDPNTFGSLIEADSTIIGGKIVSDPDNCGPWTDIKFTGGSSTCSNGATNWPDCTTGGSCSNGATNWPTCSSGGGTVGVCSSPASHTNPCTSGTPYFSNSISTWTWTCTGSNGIPSASCTETRKAPGYKEN